MHLDYERVSNKLSAVWKNVGSLVIIGFALGVLLILLGTVGENYLPEPLSKWKVPFEFIGKVINELGVGFIVAAIAVFGYELLGHISELVTEESKLEHIVGTLEQSHTILIDAAMGNFEKILDSSFPRNHKLSRSINHLIELARYLQNDLISNSSHEYLDFLEWVLAESAVTNAEGLARLNTGIQRGEKTKFDYKIPDPREVASRILAAQMKGLPNKGTYDSISDICFYQTGQMNAFIDAVEEGFTREIHVRRIFNICNLEADTEFTGNQEKFNDVKDIASQQENIAKTSGKLYEVRYIGRAIIDIVDGAADRPRYNPENDCHLVNLKNAYYGVFHNNIQRYDSVVVFIAKDIELSEMELSYSSDLRNASALMFEYLWKRCERAPNPFDCQKWNPNWLDGFTSSKS